MNITDIDDKIIKRARQNYLFQKYVQENENQIEKIQADVDEVMTVFESKIKTVTDPDKLIMMNNVLTNVTEAKKDIAAQPKDTIQNTNNSIFQVIFIFTKLRLKYYYYYFEYILYFN